MSIYSAPYGAAQGAGDEPPRPPVVREQVVASKKFLEQNSQAQINDAANIILAKHWGDISQFMLGQRQMGIILPASYKQKNYSDLALEYQRLGNQEILTLTAFPDTENPNPEVITVDLNYDGYVAWIHEQNIANSTINGVQNIVGPFDIFFNGCLIESNFQPAHNVGGYVLLFGKTALLAESYQDDKGRKKNDLITSNPTSVLQPVIPRPGWGDWPDGKSPTGVAQNKMVKELGYWIFDFENPFNPCNYLQAGSHYETWEQLTQNDGLPIKFTKGLWFEFAEKSPLDFKGPNNVICALVSPTSTVSEVLVNGVFIAEFYDRKKMRTVTQSWKYAGNISVNDSPLIWGQGYTDGGFFNGAAMKFDLTPASNKPDNTTTLLGPHDGLKTIGQIDTETGLSPGDQAILDAWHLLVHNMAVAYGISVQGFINAWTAKWATAPNQKLLNQARNVENFISNITDANGDWIHGKGSTTGDPGGLDREYVRDHNVDFFGPPQEYWFNWNAPFLSDANPLPPAGYLFRCRFDVSTQNILVETNPPPDPSAFGGSFADDPGPTSLQELIAWAKTYIPTDALHTQLAEYKQIFVDHPPPTYPNRPQVGKDYRTFSFRAITIGGSDWSFPAKFSGDK